jgi:hypothetical protein
MKEETLPEAEESSETEVFVLEDYEIDPLLCALAER